MTRRILSFFATVLMACGAAALVTIAVMSQMPVVEECRPVPKVPESWLLFVIPAAAAGAALFLGKWLHRKGSFE